jgi:hypothetical protein
VGHVFDLNGDTVGAHPVGDGMLWLCAQNRPQGWAPKGRN